MIDRTTQLIDAEWGAVHVDRLGSGRPVTFVQGLGYSSWAWQAQGQAIAEAARQAILIDNRGTGRSDEPPGPYSIADMAGDVAVVLDTLGISSSDVVGFSMGGYISQALAVGRPDLVSSLTLVATSTGGTGYAPTPAATSEAWAAASGSSPEAFARETMPLSFSPGWAEDHPEAFEEQLAMRLEHPTSSDAWTAQYDACVRFLEEGIDLSNVRVPSLIVHGDVDRVVPVSNGRELARRLPGSRLVIMEGRGHLCFIEDSSSFTSTLVGFLDEVAEKEAAHG